MMRSKFNFKLADLYFICLISAILAAFSLPGNAAALHDAVKEGNLDKVVALLDAGADVDESDYVVGGPLFIAAGRPNKDIVKVLLEGGADPDLVGESGDKTPLHQATIVGNVENIDLLISASANIDKRTSRGDTALHIASEDGNLNAMKLLIEAGTDIDVVNEVVQSTPLQSATLKGQFEAAKFLVSTGARLDVQDSQGRGLLHKAASGYSISNMGDASLVTFLFEKGAPNIKEALEWVLNHHNSNGTEAEQMVIEELKRLSKL